MHHNSNVIGPAIVKLRDKHDWTQDDLVAQLQILGCYMTRCILANIETRRSIATDIQIEYFVEVFDVEIRDLFPPRRPRANGSVNGRIVGIAADFVTRRRGAHSTQAA